MENNLIQQIEPLIEQLKQDVKLVSQSHADWWLRYLNTQTNRYLDVLKLLNNNVNKRSNLLEIGAVPGHLTILLNQLGYNVTGIDIDPDRTKLLWEKYNISVSKVDVEQEPLPINDNTYDIILFIEIIEHLRINPLFTLRELYRVLKPGGLIIVSTPNITPIDRMDFLLGRDFQEDPVDAFEKLEKIGHMGHLRLYTFKEVQRFLQKVGFEIRSHEYKGMLIRTGWKSKFIMNVLFMKKEQFRPYLYVNAIKPS